MLISLLVLSPEQIKVPIWVIHGSLYRGPITLLEPLVVLIGRHGYARENISNEGGEGEVSWGKAGKRIGLVWCWGGVWGSGLPKPK
jgi:hypothetical protein